MDNVHALKLSGFTKENKHEVNAFFHDLKGVCVSVFKSY